MTEKESARQGFCRDYLRTMDPERAARDNSLADGYEALENKMVERQLERMRRVRAGQLRREDVLRQLGRLAFGGVGDAAALALRPGEAEPDKLDLTAVAELKVTDKGGVEIKFVDRVRALETLCRLLEENGGDGVEDFFRTLEEGGTA